MDIAVTAITKTAAAATRSLDNPVPDCMNLLHEVYFTIRQH